MKREKNMRKLLLGALAVIVVGGVIVSLSRQVEGGGNDVKTVVVHDTIYKDTLVVENKEPVFVDAKWLRSQHH